MARPDRSRIPILKAAVAEIAQQGSAGIRIDAIAKAAGLNKRMIYHHYGDKEGLVCAALVAATECLGLPSDVSEDLEQALLASHPKIDFSLRFDDLRLAEAQAARILMAELLRTEASSRLLLAPPSMHRVRTLMQLVMGREEKPRYRMAADSRITGPSGLQ